MVSQVGDVLPLKYTVVYHTYMCIMSTVAYVSIYKLYYMQISLDTILDQ